MKKLMVIGAGKSQVPLIEAAKKENYHTIVCDFDPMAVGAHLADEFLQVSTKDREGLFAAAAERHIDGIVANSEYAMCDVAYIANKLGLTGNPESAVDALSSKSGFRTLQKRAGLSSPCFIEDGEIEELLTEKAPLSFPIIIKPDKSSGTRSVVTIKDPNDTAAMREAINAARNVSRNGKAMAEEYVPMQASAVIEGEIFVGNGEILWDGLFHTFRSPEMPMIPMTYVFPLQEEKSRQEKIKKALAKAFAAAGVIHGEFNIEMFFTAVEEPFIIEINPRQGGNELPKYVKESCGIDFARLLVTTAVGENYYLNSIRSEQRKSKHIIHHMLYPSASGVFDGLKMDDSIRPHIIKIQTDPAIGERIEKAHDGSYEIGFVDLAFDTAAEQMRVARHIDKLIQINIR